MSVQIGITLILVLIIAAAICEHRMRDGLDRTDSAARKHQASMMEGAIERLRQNYIHYAYAQVATSSDRWAEDAEAIEKQIQADEALLAQLLGYDIKPVALKPIHDVTETLKKRVIQ